MFLEPTQGETSNNIVRMAREGLPHPLTTALRSAVHRQEIIRVMNLRVKTNGDFTRVHLTIRPIPGDDDAKPLYLVVLEEAPPEPVAHARAKTTTKLPPEAAAQIAALQHELHAKDEFLNSTHEELQSSTEELKSINEEMQSINEDLQSTNEELETSKEELQSVNEELATVNTELQAKVADLSRSNNDMNNLLAGTGIGTIFVDFQLRIMRFTPAASTLINLILSDVGRPVAHLVPNLINYLNLVTDIQSVLNTLIPKEIDVQTTAGNWFTMRIIPYRTLENVIEGAVISFVDITRSKEIQKELREANQLRHLAVVVRDAHDAITVQDLNGLTLAWNPGASRIYGWSEAEALAMNVHERIPEDLRANELNNLTELCHSTILEPYRTRRLTRDGTSIDVFVIATALFNESGAIYAIATTERKAPKS
jgi:two-component system CheB/CheR fusion protein